MKKPIWSIKDVIDLEYFLQQDEREQGESVPAALAQRDRGIYLRQISPSEEAEGGLSPKNVVRLWLEERRKQETTAAGSTSRLPGETFVAIYRLMGYGFLIAGILSGAGLVWSLLNYRGVEPLNVSVYFAVLVLSQGLTLLVFPGIRFIRKMRRVPFGTSIVFTLVSGLMEKLIVKMRPEAEKGLESSKRGSLEAALGLIRGKRQVYGSLFYWPIFILFQIFGVGFNVSALVATLLKVIGSDIAFGWQSTIQFSAAAVYKLVRIISIPWSWCVPQELAHPSLSQIQGSHMILKDGIYHLATQDLVSWWPFLCLAVFTYGLLPRVILLTMGLLGRNRALCGIDLGQATVTRLLHRLTTPLVATEGRIPLPPEPETDRTVAGRAAQATGLNQGETVRRQGIVALIPVDIFEACRDSELGTVVSRTLGGFIEKTYRFGEDMKEDEHTLREMSSREKEGRPYSVLIIQEAWQPPIRENLRFIQDLRVQVGNTTMIWVGLIGRPRQGAVFTPVKEEEWRVWQDKVSALGDPYLGVERLVAHDH